MKTILKSRRNKNPVVYFGNDGSRWTVLHSAAYEGQIEMIKWFNDVLNFENINLKDPNNNTPMLLAIKGGKVDVVKEGCDFLTKVIILDLRCDKFGKNNVIGLSPIFKKK